MENDILYLGLLLSTVTHWSTKIKINEYLSKKSIIRLNKMKYNKIM